MHLQAVGIRSYCVLNFIIRLYSTKVVKNNFQGVGVELPTFSIMSTLFIGITLFLFYGCLPTGNGYTFVSLLTRGHPLKEATLQKEKTPFGRAMLSRQASI